MMRFFKAFLAVLLLLNVTSVNAEEINDEETEEVEENADETVSEAVYEEINPEEIVEETVDVTEVSGEENYYQDIIYIDGYFINPIYEDEITYDDLLKPEDIVIPYYGAYPGYLDEYDDMTAMVRENLIAHNTNFTVPMELTESEYQNYQSFIRDVFRGSFAHTGDPKAGDYLQYNYGGYTWKGSVSIRGSSYLMSINFIVTYYNSLEQEAELDQKVAQIVDELELKSTSLSDYQKVWRIYNYLTTNIRYDYENLNDAAYKLKFTTYAALVNNTSVCQGYASAFYRLALEAGVDARVITGVGGGPHAWDIVELDGLYYNVDSTWDENVAYTDWDYFLLCDDNFENHYRDSEFNTVAWYTVYPMSETDYVNDYYEQTCFNCGTHFILAEMCPYCGTNPALEKKVAKAVASWGAWYIGEYNTSYVPGNIGQGNSNGVSLKLSFNENSGDFVKLLKTGVPSISPIVTKVELNDMDTAMSTDVNRINSYITESVDNIDYYDVKLGFYENDVLCGYIHQSPLNKMINFELNEANGFDTDNYEYSNFKVYRCHNYTVEEIDADYIADREILQFSSDRFSTYAITYTKTLMNVEPEDHCYYCLNTETDSKGFCTNPDCGKPYDGMSAFNRKSLVLQDMIGFKPRMILTEEVQNDPDGIITFVINGRERVYKLSDGDKHSNEYAFAMYVYAKEMADEVEFYVTANGKQGTHFKYAVMDYYLDCMNQNQLDNVTIKTVKAMLNYGASAQTFTKHHTDNLANKYFTDNDISSVTFDTLNTGEYDFDVMTDTNDIRKILKNLTMDSMTNVNFKIYLANGKNIDDYKIYIDGNEVSYKDENGKYSVTTGGLKPNKLYLPHELEIKKDGMIVGKVTNFSGYSYIYLVLDPNTNANDDTKNAVKSLYLYAEAVRSQFGN